MYCENTGLNGKLDEIHVFIISNSVFDISIFMLTDYDCHCIIYSILLLADDCCFSEFLESPFVLQGIQVGCIGILCNCRLDIRGKAGKPSVKIIGFCQSDVVLSLFLYGFFIKAVCQLIAVSTSGKKRDCCKKYGCGE